MAVALQRGIVPPHSAEEASMMRRVLATSVIGTAIEWYDFFLYATASALVFNKLFFPTFDPVVGTILSFGTFFVGYVSRPLGAILFGHFGDRIGRKTSLVATLLIMGVATFVIGCLPSYESIGFWAPALLILMRFMQGIGVGGEWGGAVLMVVEYAPANRRGFFGSWPQWGVPLGLLLSTGAFSLVAGLPQDQFLSWGWRIPFLISIVLVAIGLFIRLKVTESPRFEAVKNKGVQAKAPLVELLRRYPRQILLAIGTRFATDITFNVINVFVLAYATQQLGLPRSLILNAVLVACFVELFTIPIFGWLSDQIGRRTVFMMGCAFVAVYGFVFFQLLETREPTYIFLGYVGGLALSQASVYAVQSTWFAELFGTRVRYTGASLPYQIAGIVTSGPTPLLATYLFATYGTTWPIAGYIAATAILSLVCAYFLAETYKRDLDADVI
ncbi:MAG: major facilitator superfamily 1 [Enterovirga sp.]|jgi:MHS family shikimate/dehydroshikimate transporter-like MFS transporter|nr:major facilitator superfamily 1 [Enterovirga sp.]